MLHKPEEHGGLTRVRAGFATVEIPQKRLAARAGLPIFLVAPERPDRRVVALDAFVVRQNRLKGCEDLQPFVAVPVPSAREERPEIPAAARVSSLGVSFDRV